ncbi:hypothetical protein K2173_003316 [Erythroxylum novogranatense]|uniref:Transmembrane protein 18 n=1 Tax=Erythroxylum novogranatense TaxID=1862640 RepID=A0AAV8SYG3_9ROSI|nr:hypothetical protein K2173_003316 [Erythroxylum novogranatense]
MDDLRSALDQHMDQMADLVQKLSSELRSGLRPAYDNFIGFFHAIDWREPWLMGLLGFHFLLLIVTIISRKHTNFQMFLFLLALSGVYFAERLNKVLSENWRTFASQNYFDPHGLFLSVLWSGPLLVIAMIILVSLCTRNLIFFHFWSLLCFIFCQVCCLFLILQVNTLLSLCYLIVKWKRAELRHRARVSHKKED